MGVAPSTQSLLLPSVVPLEGGRRDHDALLDRIGDARFVLLGEASHGTHEFYRERACITRRLVEERGFDAVAIEGDWPDVHRLNRWAKGASADRDADAALSSFGRFPTWMWRNKEMIEFVRWLRAHNESRASRTPARRKIDIYGLDLFSLYASMDAVLTYLERVDPAAAKRARARYACFGHYGKDSTGVRPCRRPGPRNNPARTKSCSNCRRDSSRSSMPGTTAGRRRATTLFHVEQSARLVKNGEGYYRFMFRGATATWNLRDRHMADTLGATSSVARARFAFGRTIRSSAMPAPPRWAAPAPRPGQRCCPPRAPRTRSGRRLSTRDGETEPLVRRAPRRSVRRGRPHRLDERRRAARAQRTLARPRRPRHLPVRRVRARRTVRSRVDLESARALRSRRGRGRSWPAGLCPHLLRRIARATRPRACRSAPQGGCSGGSRFSRPSPSDSMKP